MAFLKENKDKKYFDENESLMTNGRVTSTQQSTSGVIKQAKSVENLQGLILKITFS